jgi:hypothetical protein
MVTNEKQMREQEETGDSLHVDILKKEININ